MSAYDSLPVEHLCLFGPEPRTVNLQAPPATTCPLMAADPAAQCQCRLQFSVAAARAAYVDPQKVYLLQCALAEGHSTFGAVAERKPPHHPSEAAAEMGAGVQAGDWVKAHPLLSDKAQFSGEFEPDTALPERNHDAQEEVLEKRLALAHAQKQTYIPKFER